MQVQLVRSKTNGSRLAEILSSLEEALIKVHHEEAGCLAQGSLLPPQQHKAILFSLSVLGDIIADVSCFAGNPHDPEAVVSKLGELSGKISVTLQEYSPSFAASRACATLGRVVELLNRAKARIVHVFQLQERMVATSLPTAYERVLLPTDFLYLCRYSLFPAERMAVVAGFTAPEGTLLLGASFDVTQEEGNTCSTHVKADPVKLGRALLSMECSGTLLGAWVHSHPGVGSTATWPSEIDTTQHKKWIRDYHPNLVSIVMVENGYFRCFGQAIESGQIALRFQGTGVIQEEEEHVYRLTQEA